MLCEFMPSAARENTALVRFSSTCRKKSVINYTYTQTSRTRRDSESQWSYSRHIRMIGWRCGCGAGDWTDVCDRGRPVSRYIFIGARVCLCRTFPCAEQTRAVRCALYALCALCAATQAAVVMTTLRTRFSNQRQVAEMRVRTISCRRKFIQ